MTKFYPGIGATYFIEHLERFIWNFTETLVNRKSPLPIDVQIWMLDSGGFRQVIKYGKYRHTHEKYLSQIEMLKPKYFFNMDYMCESFALEKTGLSIKEHIEKTIDNHITILDKLNDYNIKSQFLGVIQGFEVDDYIYCIDRMKEQDIIQNYMGVGSVCRRNAEREIYEVLNAIHNEIPDTKLHAFGVKGTIFDAPYGSRVVELLHSCDSMAWSMANWHGPDLRGKKRIPFLVNWVKGMESKIAKWEDQISLTHYT